MSEHLLEKTTEPTLASSTENIVSPALAQQSLTHNSASGGATDGHNSVPLSYFLKLGHRIGDRGSSVAAGAAALFRGMYGKGNQDASHHQSPKGALAAPAIQLAESVKHVEELLTPRLFTLGTKDHAREALNTLLQLPAELQGQAIAKLHPDAFERLITTIAEADREQFQPLISHTHDPERKLRLWAEYHKSRAVHDAAKEKEKTKDEGRFWWRSKEQKENQHTNERRDEIVKTTQSEVDDEVAGLRKKKESGGLTEMDVDRLIQRKDHEHQLEMQYNVNLVNDRETRKSDGTKIVWTDADLTEVESGLARMPKSHVKGNQLLKEIRRSDISEDEKSKHEKDVNYEPITGGDHGSGVIRIFDAGKNATFAHSGDTRELADPRIVPAAGKHISSIEEALVHEFGHDIHDQENDAFKHFQRAAGWSADLDSGDLKKKGLSKRQIGNLDEKEAEIERAGKQYMLDPYNFGLFGGNRYLSRDNDTIPTPELGAAPNPRSVERSGNPDTWRYARTNYKDHFAETYAKAILVPDKLVHDLIDAPEERVKELTTKVNSLKSVLNTLQSTPPLPSEADLGGMRDSIKDAEAELHDALRSQKAQRQQFDIMRNEIFHTDQAEVAVAQRLRAKGVPENKVQEFIKRADRASTPEQLSFIAQGF